MDSKVAKRLLFAIQSDTIYSEPGPVQAELSGTPSHEDQLLLADESDRKIRRPSWESYSVAGPAGTTGSSAAAPPPPPVPSPAASSGAEGSAFQVRKGILQNKVKVASDDVADELATSRNDVIVVCGFTVLAIGAAAGAGILSNTAGFITTVVAGGGGTVGLAASLKGSLLSYGDLKNYAHRKLRHAAEQVHDAQNDADLDEAQATLSELSTWLDSQAKPSQVVSPPSSVT